MSDMERTQVTDEVLNEIARSALQQIPEVVAPVRKNALSELTQLVSERIAPQVTVKRQELEGSTQAVSFDLKLTLVYGCRIPEVVSRVRDSIKTEVETLTGFKVERVDILVEKLVRQDSPDCTAPPAK